MDRIQDSGSYDRGSIPRGGTKKGLAQSPFSFFIKPCLIQCGGLFQLAGYGIPHRFRRQNLDAAAIFAEFHYKVLVRAYEYAEDDALAVRGKLLLAAVDRKVAQILRLCS